MEENKQAWNEWRRNGIPRGKVDEEGKKMGGNKRKACKNKPAEDIDLCSIIYIYFWASLS